MDELAKYISLVLTVPTIMLSSIVVFMYFKSAWRAVLQFFGKSLELSDSVKEVVLEEDSENRKQRRVGVNLLIVGIVISFIGDTIDNFYWGLAWGSDFFGSQWRDFLFQNGVYSNIPFRQTAGIIAAVLHLWDVFPSSAIRNRVFWWVSITSIVAAILLIGMDIHRDNSQKEEEAQTYWINLDSGTRHNSDCLWYRNTGSGVPCSKEDGKRCKHCGG